MKLKNLTLALASMAFATSSLNVNANVSSTEINSYLDESLKAMAKYKDVHEKWGPQVKAFQEKYPGYAIVLGAARMLSNTGDKSRDAIQNSQNIITMLKREGLGSNFWKLIATALEREPTLTDKLKGAKDMTLEDAKTFNEAIVGMISAESLMGPLANLVIYPLLEASEKLSKNAVVLVDSFAQSQLTTNLLLRLRNQAPGAFVSFQQINLKNHYARTSQGYYNLGASFDLGYGFNLGGLVYLSQDAKVETLTQSHVQTHDDYGVGLFANYKIAGLSLSLLGSVISRDNDVYLNNVDKRTMIPPKDGQYYHNRSVNFGADLAYTFNISSGFSLTPSVTYALNKINGVNTDTSVGFDLVMPEIASSMYGVNLNATFIPAPTWKLGVDLGLQYLTNKGINDYLYTKSKVLTLNCVKGHCASELVGTYRFNTVSESGHKQADDQRWYANLQVSKDFATYGQLTGFIAYDSYKERLFNGMTVGADYLIKF